MKYFTGMSALAFLTAFAMQAQAAETPVVAVPTTSLPVVAPVTAGVTTGAPKEEITLAVTTTGEIKKDDGTIVKKDGVKKDDIKK